MIPAGIGLFFNQSIVLETFQGVNSYGDIFAAPVTVTGCYVDDSRKLVRNKDGEQVISETTLYTSTANAALFTPDSRVTVPGASDDNLNPQRAARVIKVNTNDAGIPVMPNHTSVMLT
jgi:hypothetical protein